MSRLGTIRSMSPVTRCAVFERGNKVCVWCLRKLYPFGVGGKGKLSLVSIDHYVPVAKGGSSKIDNVLPSCTKCNYCRLWPESFTARLAARGLTPEDRDREAKAQLLRPIDRQAGRRLCDRWYPGLIENRARLKARSRARRKTDPVLWDPASFPFGANVEKACQ